MRKTILRPAGGRQLTRATEYGILFASVAEQCPLPGAWCMMASLSGWNPQKDVGHMKKNGVTV